MKIGNNNVLQKLDNSLSQLGIIISIQQKKQLLAYVDLLVKWNKAYNLTAVRDPEQMLIRHIIDSIVVEPHLSGSRFIDVGSGAGLPGVPLAIIRPDSHFILLDSLGKRIRFLTQVKYELSLNNIQPIQSRVEEYQATPRFDGVISRAFASLQDMLLWCRDLPRQPDGCFYALKGERPDAELASLPAGIQLVSVIRLQVPGLGAERHLITLSCKQD